MVHKRGGSSSTQVLLRQQHVSTVATVVLHSSLDRPGLVKAGERRNEHVPSFVDAQVRCIAHTCAAGGGGVRALWPNSNVVTFTNGGTPSHAFRVLVMHDYFDTTSPYHKSLRQTVRCV